MTKNDPARRYVGAHLWCAQKGWADTQVRPYEDERTGYAVGTAPCGRPQSLPPTGGKVAFAEQMTDEGAGVRGGNPPGPLTTPRKRK